MSRSIKLKRGIDIRLKGIAIKKISGAVNTYLSGVKPIDFPGLIPKLDIFQCHTFIRMDDSLGVP